MPLVAMLAAGVAPDAQAACRMPELSVDAAAVHSRWREFDAQQRRLLLEQGTLRRSGLGVSSNCLGGETMLAWRRTVGTRDYDGLSNVGAPIQTVSQLRADEWQLSHRQPIAGPWSLSARLSSYRLHRDLAGVGAVQGYPEQFTYWQAALGARLALPVGASLQLAADAWWGGGPAGRLALRLPTADPTSLSLGTTRSAELALRLQPRHPAGTGWTWDAGIEQRLTLLAAGPPGALMRNGALVGGAAQPRTRQGEFALGGRVGLRF